MTNAELDALEARLRRWDKTTSYAQELHNKSADAIAALRKQLVDAEEAYRRVFAAEARIAELEAERDKLRRQNNVLGELSLSLRTDRDQAVEALRAVYDTSPSRVLPVGVDTVSVKVTVTVDEWRTARALVAPPADGGGDDDEQRQIDEAQEERRRLENAEMDEHFRRHPHG